MVSAVILFQVFQHKKMLFYPLMLLLIVSQAVYSFHHDRNGDDSLGFEDGAKVHQNAVRFLEAENLYDARIYAHFLMMINLSHPLSGYLSSNRVFTNLTDQYNDHVDFAIISSTELTYELDSIRHLDHLILLKKFEKGEAWTEIYKNNLMK